MGTLVFTAKHVLLLFALAQQEPAAAAVPEESDDSCVWCHAQLEDEMLTPVEGMKTDVHARVGLSCADCHGGDATVGFDFDLTVSMDEEKGYLGVPDREDIPKFCARCHSDPGYMRQFNPRLSTDQYERYQTSIHGQRLKQGDTQVATCIDCHGVHGILKANDSRSPVYSMNVPGTCGRCHSDADYMAAYDIPVDQEAKYQRSVHGVALLETGDRGAPACNNCHGNHGASPPGAPSVAYVCGQCHLHNSELFLESPHFEGFEILGLPECQTCHGNHDIQPPVDEMVGGGPGSLCVDCHEGETEVLDTANGMRSRIDELKEVMTAAHEVVSRAEQAGMQVSEAKFLLSEADDSLIQSRTIVHSLSIEKLAEIAERGVSLAREAEEEGYAALRELQFRRKGLAVALVFILLLAAGLFLKIREVDQMAPWR